MEQISNNWLAVIVLLSIGFSFSYGFEKIRSKLALQKALKKLDLITKTKTMLGKEYENATKNISLVFDKIDNLQEQDNFTNEQRLIVANILRTMIKNRV